MGFFLFSLNFTYFRTDVKLSLQQLFNLVIKQHHFGFVEESKEEYFLKNIDVLYASFNVFGSSCPSYSVTLHNTHNDDVQEF